MNLDSTAKNLFHDVAVELLEKARQAKQEAQVSGSDYSKGRHFAFYETMSLICQQAAAFELPLEVIGLGSLDVERELL